MNCLSAVRPRSLIPFFDDEQLSQSVPCKVYHDGCHYVAVQMSTLKSERSRKPRKLIDYAFDEYYFEAVKSGITEQKRERWILTKLEEEYPDELNLDKFVSEKCEAKIHNSYARRKRFRRKAYLNEWNYFVTFTYSDEKHSEESFRVKLRKCLSNLHSRRGWRYMGVPEYSPESHRLHYHLLVYVPNGQMIGELREVRDYSTKYKRMQTRHVNSFFEETFGRNDFEPIDVDRNFALTRTIDYILKYMEKSDEKIIYSRGIPTELQAEIDGSMYASEFVDYVVKMVLFDDVIEDGEYLRDKNKIDDYDPLEAYLRN